MKPTPTGTLRSTDTGFALELTRTIAASREDVWASLTESPRTALWFGPWERILENTVRVVMRFEEGQPASDMAIEACEPPSRLAVRTIDDMQWPIEVRLDEKDGSTVVVLVHSCERTDGLGDIGPGWEYYLDMLIASREGTPLPSFDDYYPSQQEYYASLRPQ
ncbi:ATPase [Rhodococcus sp. 06-462-5]|uniref:SRPBCC domain-containing protein n=1 Tax=unclassified Rhodococcus (in: high G+C Gram-positive bacteria) TaxID=192944 RepID=UPI000B9C1FE5|nr:MULTISPECIES: SRPBCC domain-containing protein [unclassified Rhodococcus (in: high G+C Gram-positive bacteria)]OZC76152.1 ATPase [Rhodococcus sp. 06-462-5]OZE57879.1 ATPase [Rhodococcus sp. 02-925g]